MASGQDTQLTRQIGEHLVTAELGRRKIIATPFAGNVPHIDILAYIDNKAIPIQVKAINGTSWQFDIRAFLDVDKTESGQTVNGLKNINPEIICIFVVVGKSLGQDEFYIFKLKWLQDYFSKTFIPRQPPKNIDSFHCAIWKKELQEHLDNWNVVIESI